MPSRLSQAIVTFAVFVLLGPPIGSLAFGVIATVVSAFTDPDIGLLPLKVSIFFIALGYMVGGLQAAFAGAVTAVAVWRNGFAPFWVPLAASVLAGIVMAVRVHEKLSVTATLISIHVAAALGCWLILRFALRWRRD